MGIRLDNDGGFEDLKGHVGHQIECVHYGATREPPVNVALECVTCGCVLIDFNAPEGSVATEPPRSESRRKKRA